MSGFISQWLPAVSIKPMTSGMCTVRARYGFDLAAVRFGTVVESLPGLSLQLALEGRELFEKPVVLADLAARNTPFEVRAFERLVMRVINATSMHVEALAFVRVLTPDGYKPVQEPFEVLR